MRLSLLLFFPFSHQYEHSFFTFTKNKVTTGVLFWQSWPEVRSSLPSSLTLPVRSSSATEQERVAVNVSAAAFSIKKHKLRLETGGPSPAAFRDDLGGPRTMIHFRQRLVTARCFDDKRGYWTSVEHNEGIRYSLRWFFLRGLVRRRVTLFINASLLDIPTKEQTHRGDTACRNLVNSLLPWPLGNSEVIWEVTGEEDTS